MNDLTAKTPWHVTIDLMFHALKVTNEVLNAHAAHLLCQLRGGTVSQMVREASRPKNGLPTGCGSSV